jgi:hypothetical protein
MHAGFMIERFRAHQIVRLVESASMQLDMMLTKRSIARAFEVDHSAVKRALQCSYEDPPAPERNRELSVEKEQVLVS